MKTIEVTDKMHAALMEISNELNMQDHLCTAMPYIFQIQTKHQIAVPEGNGIQAWFYDGSLIEKEDEIIEAIYDYKDGSMSKKKIKELDEDDRNDLMEKIGYRKVYYDYEKKCENAFFTKKGAEEHIRVNGHNLKKPQVFLNHAFRNTEMELVMSFLCELSGGKIHK
jgi:hypothetical protein